MKTSIKTFRHAEVFISLVLAVGVSFAMHSDAADDALPNNVCIIDLRTGEHNLDWFPNVKMVELECSVTPSWIRYEIDLHPKWGYKNVVVETLIESYPNPVPPSLFGILVQPHLKSPTHAPKSRNYGQKNAQPMPKKEGQGGFTMREGVYSYASLLGCGIKDGGRFGWGACIAADPRFGSEKESYRIFLYENNDKAVGVRLTFMPPRPEHSSAKTAVTGSRRGVTRAH